MIYSFSDSDLSFYLFLKRQKIINSIEIDKKNINGNMLSLTNCEHYQIENGSVPRSQCFQHRSGIYQKTMR